MWLDRSFFNLIYQKYYDQFKIWEVILWGKINEGLA